MFESLEREEKLAGRKLADLRKKSHIPGQLLELVEKVLEAQSKARAQAKVNVPDSPDLAPVEKVIQGAALLPRESFTYDAGQASTLFESFTDLLSGMGGPMAQAAAMVRAEGEPLMTGAFEAFIKDDKSFFDAFAARTPQAPRTLAFLAQSSLTPSIMALAGEIAKTLPAERTWDHAACPVCGSLAFHSAFRNREGVRVNSCSFCRADYRTFRLQCAYCEERDAGKLPYFTADEEPGYRVEACESCKGYIKITDFREFDRPSLAPLDDLESLTLDILAARKGFVRPTPSAWGF
ncbi:MAG: formate dehydrogenase accessory protein FdhE [Thermodesulfobacteriota bacterium]